MKSRNISKILFIVYILGLIWLVLFKLSFSFAEIPRYRAINLDPFHDALKHPIRTREVIDNVLIFIPFGAFTCIINNRKNIFQKIFPVFMTSLTFEILQFVFALGSTDVNDLITNTVGGIIGMIIFCILKRIFGRNAEKVVNTIAVMFLILVSILMGITYYYN